MLQKRNKGANSENDYTKFQIDFERIRIIIKSNFGRLNRKISKFEYIIISFKIKTEIFLEI